MDRRGKALQKQDISSSLAMKSKEASEIGKHGKRETLETNC